MTSISHHVVYVCCPSFSVLALLLTPRPLDGLAVSRSAPKIFLRTTRSGLPYVAVTICSCFAFLAYMTLGTSSGIVFTWLSNFSATSGLISWFGISLTYLRFYKGMKVQHFDRSTLPFTSRLQPFLAWYGVCGSAFVLFVRRAPLPPPSLCVV